MSYNRIAPYHAFRKLNKQQKKKKSNDEPKVATHLKSDWEKGQTGEKIANPVWWAIEMTK